MNEKECIKILVVEDAPGDVFLIKFYLEELDPEGYEIESVDNLKEAHEKIERNAFDVILLDLHLPDSEGMVTLTNTVEKYPDEVYIVLTGLSDEKVGVEAVKNGAQDFLVKGKITSVSLDSSIKFSYQRAKLKKAVKLFGESIKVLEGLYDFRVLILDFNDGSVIHSFLLPKYVGVEASIDYIDDFCALFESNKNLKSELKAVIKGKDLEMVNNFNGEEFNLKFSNSETLDNIVVGTIKKLKS